MASDLDIDGPADWPRQPYHQASKISHPYSPSVASTASSSSDSVFSVDAPSSQSSEPSLDGWSSLSDRSSWLNESENLHLEYQEITPQQREDVDASYNPSLTYQSFKSTQAVAPESRQHPRRTQRLDSSGSQDGKARATCPRPPPSLVRQSERKDNFVDSLVDTTTQMIETIWPLSVLSCGRDNGLGGKQQNLIGLRTFVQEVLRRSKTSYSTLQVALYYLILIQSCIPKHDFTMEQSEDSTACRAMQCGRRMFLAALILASKYLQDRNYSARAWSKISGLGTSEININEMAFLSAVNWKLHIPEPVFHRWTDIVLKYSPSAQVNTSPRSFPICAHSWKSIVPLLTPDLDTCSFRSGELLDDSGYNSPGSESDMSPPPIPIREESSPASEPDEPTPTNPYTIPRTLESIPGGSRTSERMAPPLPHLETLPTPQLTPQTGTFGIPAASASGRCLGGSMSYAMTQIRNFRLAKSTLDNPYQARPNIPGRFPTPSRRSSLAQSASSGSSPESTISNVSSRTSRSSSISSAVSSNCALPPPNLAAQATRRCATMQLSSLKEENQKPMPTNGNALHSSLLHRGSAKRTYPEPQERDLTSHGRVASPKPRLQNECLREAAGALHDLQLQNQSSLPALDECPLDPASLPVRDPSIQHRASFPVPNQYSQNLDSLPAAVPRPQKGRKRCRPNSMDISVQSSVREVIAPRCLGDITNKSSIVNSMVLPDAKRPDSFLVPKSGSARPSSSHSNAKPALSGECLPRKRTCAGSDRGGREEARLMMQRLKESESRQGPGMWEGVI